MSALARYFKQRGDEVSGYDRTPSPLTEQLQREGIPVHYEDNPALIPAEIDLVIYTPAVPADTQEFLFLQQQGVRMLKRSQVLGELTRDKKCIAVAGSHGKTTTSAMIAHLLSKSSIGCSAFLGGIAKNFNSNLLVDNKSEWIVVEADEYDRSFLQLHPHYAVITATDPDHLDIYGTHANLLAAFTQFANQTQPNGTIFVKEGIGYARAESEGLGKHFSGKAMIGGRDIDSLGCTCRQEQETLQPQPAHNHGRCGLDIDNTLAVASYSARSIESDYYAINVRHYGSSIYFDLRTPKKVYYDLELTNAGLYNVENATVAAAVAFSCGLTEGEVRHGLKTFAGIQRRFDYRINDPKLVYIDDYAHHPNEIAATIESVRYLYPGKRIVGIFQPHLYSRTADLYKEFAEALAPLDEIILMDIYPAREKPIPGVTSRLIMNEIHRMNRYLVARDEVPTFCVALCPDVVLSMGAGDIDREVSKIEQHLRECILDD